MVDRDGDKIGTITDFYLDSETGQPEWAAVDTELHGTRSTFVPLSGANEHEDYIQVPYEKANIKDAPTVEPGTQLTEEEEARLYHHYDIEYPGRYDTDYSEDVSDDVEPAEAWGSVAPQGTALSTQVGEETSALFWRVTIRELSRNTSKVLAAVYKQQRPVVVTYHGEPTFIIEPIDQDRLAALILGGVPEFVGSVGKAEAGIRSRVQTAERKASARRQAAPLAQPRVIPVPASLMPSQAREALLEQRLKGTTRS